jgi:hypothetical protein
MSIDQMDVLKQLGVAKYARRRPRPSREARVSGPTQGAQTAF